MGSTKFKKKYFSTKELVYLAVLIALSYVGSIIKVFESIAFDSMPAFFAALVLGPVAGSIVGILGHLFTAATSGFPYSLPVHMVVAFQMGIICFLFGYIGKNINIYLATIIAILLNGVAATYISVYAMQLTGLIPVAMDMFKILVLPLTIASSANVVFSVILYKTIGHKIK